MIKKILILLLPIFFFSCGKSPEKEEKPLVLVSISPYKYFVTKIAGDTVRVESIVPEAVNSHTYEPTAKEITALHGADLWFQVGDPFEAKMEKSLTKKNPKLKIYDLKNYVKLIPYEDDTGHTHDDHHHHHSSMDIHVWLSPPLVARQSEIIAEMLSELVPEHASLYRANFHALLEELSDLDTEIRAQLKSIPSRTFLTSHPSFGYFCMEYGLEQLSIEFEGKEPLPRTLEKIAKRAREDNVKVALIQPQFSSKGAVIIAKQLGIPTRMVDPYSAEYKKTMLRIMRVLKNPNNP